MLNETHGLRGALCSQNAITTDANKIETGKPRMGFCHSISFCKPLHIAINGDQYGIICHRGGTYDLVGHALHQNLAMEYDRVAALRKDARNRIRNAFV